MKRVVMTAVGIAGLLTAQAALAVTTWTFTSGGTETGANAYGNSRKWTSGGTSVTATAWSNTKDSATYGSNTLLEQGYLAQYSGGLAVENKDCQASYGAASCHSGAQGGDTGETSVPEHSMDNSGRFDSELFQFGSSVKMTSVSVGWPSANDGYDSDIYILAYTGSGTPTDGTTLLKNYTYAQLISNGWSVVGTYTDMAQRLNGTATVNALGITSAYWLIGAFNPIAGAAPDSSYDYVKIASVSADTTPPPPPPSVPEPASLLLVGAALAGIRFARKLH